MAACIGRHAPSRLALILQRFREEARMGGRGMLRGGRKKSHQDHQIHRAQRGWARRQVP